MLNRRAFLRKLGVGAAVVAVVPPVALAAPVLKPHTDEYNRQLLKGLRAKWVLCNSHKRMPHSRRLFLERQARLDLKHTAEICHNEVYPFGESPILQMLRKFDKTEPPEAYFNFWIFTTIHEDHWKD